MALESMKQQLPMFTSEVTKPVEREYFRTPDGVADYAVTCLWQPDGCPLVLDPGAGDGVWGEAVLRRCPNAYLVGVDLPIVSPSPAYQRWLAGDFRRIGRKLIDSQMRFDLIVSNPPFSLAEEFVALCYELLAPGGRMLFFLRLAFLAGQSRCVDLWPSYPLRALAVSAKRPSFTGDGVTDPRTEYAVFVWEQGYHGRGEIVPSFHYEHISTWRPL